MLGNVLGIVAQIEQERDAVHGIFGRGMVDKGYDEMVLLLLILDGEAGVAVADGGGEEADVVVLASAPGEAPDGAEGFLGDDGGVDVLVVGAVEKHLAVDEELEFFGNFLRTGEEIFVMGLADIGEDADGGLDDLAEVVHFARLGDAGLEDCHLMVGSHLPDGDGDADL